MSWNTIDRKFDLNNHANPDLVKELALWLEGYADAQPDNKIKIRLRNAAYLLDDLEDHICAGGFVGCDGGRKCTSDHK
jgi:hypothetical protein